MAGTANLELVSPDKFSPAQQQYIDALAESVREISAHTDLMLGFKDIHSRHVMSTDAYATKVGLPHGEDVAYRFDREMPCESTAEFADCFVREDQELLIQMGAQKRKSVLNVHEFSDIGLDAVICDKYPIIHKDSASILGISYTARKIELSSFLALIPDYFFEFGMGCSAEGVTGALLLNGTPLTEYEHEVGFLIVMNWDAKKIAQFMDDYQPNAEPRSADTIYKCRNRIAEKLNCHPANLRDLLIELGVHQRIPAVFFKRLIGSWSL